MLSSKEEKQQEKFCSEPCLMCVPLCTNGPSSLPLPWLLLKLTCFLSFSHLCLPAVSWTLQACLFFQGPISSWDALCPRWQHVSILFSLPIFKVTFLVQSFQTILFEIPSPHTFLILFSSLFLINTLLTLRKLFFSLFLVSQIGTWPLAYKPMRVGIYICFIHWYKPYELRTVPST